MPPRKRRKVNNGVNNASKVAISPSHSLGKINSEWRDVFVNEGGRLYVMLDFGTTKHAAAYAIDRKGSAEPLNINARQLSLDDTSGIQPADLGFRQEASKIPGKKVFSAVHGKDVHFCCLRKDILPKNVFKNLKQSQPFINAQEMDKSEHAESLRKTQQRHADLLARLRGSEIIVYHEATDTRGVTSIENMKDVVRVQMTLLRLDIMAALQRISQASSSLIEEIFSGDPSKPFGLKLQVGVAAPELWDRQRLVLYEALVEAGFPPQLEILSEAKAAAAAVMKIRYDSILGPAGNKSADDIKDLASKIIMVVDRGGHTLDISSMRLAEVSTIKGKTSLKFRAVTSSDSTEDGGDRANDNFMNEIENVFGLSYDTVIGHLSNQDEQDGKLALIQGFQTSIEQEKKRPESRNKQDSLALAFDNDNGLPPGSNRRVAAWTSRKLTLKKWRLEASVDAAVRAILSEQGPVLAHIRRTREVEPDAPIEIVLSGGSSKDPIFLKDLNKLVREHHDMQDVTLGSEDHNGESLVSQGGIYLLVDPLIGDDNIVTRRSYGIVYTAEYDESNPRHRFRAQERQPMQQHAIAGGYQSKYELPNTVDWLAPMGSRVRTVRQTIAMSHQIVLNEGEIPDPSRVIDLRFGLVSTDREDLGMADGWSAQQEGIDDTTEFCFDISTKELAKCTRDLPQAEFGFLQYKNEDWWKLDFDYKILYRWAGMLQIFEVRIPYGGYFPENRELSLGDMYVLRFQLVGECSFRDDEDRITRQDVEG